MKIKRFLPLCAIIFLSLTSCNKGITRVEDERSDIKIEDFTILNLSCKDALGRELKIADSRKSDKKIGLFYHIWHGTHNTSCDDISTRFDITNLLANDPDSLWNGTIDANKFFYWGEPLYGYYNSGDPFVITRHLELLTNAGIDYLAFDMTNTVIYTSVVNQIFEIFDKYQKQGFNVPKICFVTHSSAGATMKRCYETWYKQGKYSNLWYSRDGVRPYIIGYRNDLIKQYLTKAEGEQVADFFDLGEVIWPDEAFQDPSATPWMDWRYPQTNFDGTMVVSLAQHPGYKMSDQETSNHGRGFDYVEFVNKSENVDKGSNFAGQYQTVFDTNDSTNKDYDKDYEINNVFITGFNEWIAVKQIDVYGNPFWCDTFNEEYSRDIEMTSIEGGYGDNYYLQLIELNRKYAYEEGKHYLYDTHAIDIFDSSLSEWKNVKTNYKDFEGDTIERNYISANQRSFYVNNTNRNDIVKTSITHDNNNLYVKVETSEDLTSRSDSDLAYMNVMINTKKNEDSFMGFDYVINRSQSGNKCSIERLKKEYKASKVGEADISINGKVMQISISLKTLGLNVNECNISLKVTDNIQDQGNELSYYVDGDSAPIGRLGYDYGY